MTLQLNKVKGKTACIALWTPAPTCSCLSCCTGRQCWGQGRRACQSVGGGRRAPRPSPAPWSGWRISRAQPPEPVTYFNEDHIRCAYNWVYSSAKSQEFETYWSWLLALPHPYKNKQFFSQRIRQKFIFPIKIMSHSCQRQEQLFYVWDGWPALFLVPGAGCRAGRWFRSPAGRCPGRCGWRCWGEWRSASCTACTDSRAVARKMR